MADPYFSELKYLGGPTLDFIEVAVDAGTDVSNLIVTIYNANGTIRSTNAVAGLSNTTVAGKDVYVIESGSPSSFSGLAKSNAVALSDDTSVFSFVSFTDTAADVTATTGPASGMTSEEIGSAGSGQSLETTNVGTSYSVQTAPSAGTIPCLTRGTQIQVSQGFVKVEDLKAGMRVKTLDGSFKPLKWVMSKRVVLDGPNSNAKLRPVRICAGALGNNLPQRDLLVSRQHRMLVSSPIVQRMFDKSSVLIAANKLTALAGIGRWWMVFLHCSLPILSSFSFVPVRCFAGHQSYPC